MRIASPYRIEFEILNVVGGRKVFREFLRSEYSEENMLFWLACEDLKREENPEVVEEKARLIYEDYISILSPKEVRSYFMCILQVFVRDKVVCQNESGTFHTHGTECIIFIRRIVFLVKHVYFRLIALHI